MSEEKIPFVGLHAHSVAGSIFDAIGYPPQHMDFAYENGSEALALTILSLFMVLKLISHRPSKTGRPNMIG